MLYQALSLLSVLSSLGHSSPIIGGTDVGRLIRQEDYSIVAVGQDEFPFMAHITIFYEVINGNGVKQEKLGTCGGVIIREDAVLTTAHCIVDEVSKPFLYVRAGMVDFALESMTAPGSWARGYVKMEGYVDKYQVSDDFKLIHLSDIAIIWLRTSFTLGINIGIATLSTFGGPFSNELGWILGWGEDATGFQKHMLQKAQTRIISNAECKAIHSKFMISPDMFCLLSDTRTTQTCGGDSGGPFVVGKIVYGLSSFGPRVISSTGEVFCNPSRPEVFTHVGMYSEWILEKLREGPQSLLESPSTSPGPSASYANLNKIYVQKNQFKCGLQLNKKL